ncbi:uncharacterized protein NPIL_449051, partial [Nephila pilipes]
MLFFLLSGSFKSQCGGYITNSKGYIHTPNFPKPYKVPIHCQWIFEAPLGSKVSMYFTQFYMKKGITAADYTYYSRHIKAGVGRYDFGIISSDDEPTYLVSNQQILVLTMNVRSLDNIHLRVREHLLDVSGFNITYEMILSNETVRGDPCIYHHCSFTGNCFVSTDYRSYTCKCFTNYFGEECQYDDTCGPNSTSSVCLNGGTCRYYIGSSVRTCECLTGYTGAKCESLISDMRNKAFNGSELECPEMYYQSPQGYFSVYPKRKNCHDEESMIILRLEISEFMPVSEGVPLLIACIVHSRHDVNVTWLKDGFPIMFESSRGRLWTMQVPKDSSGRSSFLLGIDKVNEHDIGTVTCLASEGTRSENLSVTINVKLVSKLMINPLSATVVKGNSVSITCVSIDGIYSASSYSWLKNNADIHRKRDPEKVEYLYPGGTRLILKNAEISMNYTCIMRTQTGFLRLTSILTVVNASDFETKTCQQEKSYGVRWKITGVNSVDIHLCPEGYTGFIRRLCKLNEKKRIEWDEPDFSTCISEPILALKEEFDSWKMGYKKKAAMTLLTDLYNFLSSKSSSMHNSEGEPIIDMLFDADISSFLEADAENNWNLFLRGASLLFQLNLVQKHT